MCIWKKKQCSIFAPKNFYLEKIIQMHVEVIREGRREGGIIIHRKVI